MRCDEKYFVYMNMAIDGELGEAELAELKAHLESCGECRSLYENLKILAAETALLEEEPSPELTGKIMSAVRGAKKTTGKPAHTMRLIVSIASTAAVFVTVLLGGRLVFRGAGAAMDAGAAPESAADDMAIRVEMQNSSAYDGDTGDTVKSSSAMEDYDYLADCVMPEAPAEDMKAEESENLDNNGHEAPADRGENAFGADLADLYGLDLNAYRYVLVFRSAPVALSGESWESDGAVRRCVLENSAAEALLEDCLKSWSGAPDAAESIVIEDPNA